MARNEKRFELSPRIQCFEVLVDLVESRKEFCHIAEF